MHITKATLWMISGLTIIGSTLVLRDAGSAAAAFPSPPAARSTVARETRPWVDTMSTCIQQRGLGARPCLGDASGSWSTMPVVLTASARTGTAPPDPESGGMAGDDTGDAADVANPRDEPTDDAPPTQEAPRGDQDNSSETQADAPETTGPGLPETKQRDRNAGTRQRGGAQQGGHRGQNRQGGETSTKSGDDETASMPDDGESQSAPADTSAASDDTTPARDNGTSPGGKTVAQGEGTVQAVTPDPTSKPSVGPLKNKTTTTTTRTMRKSMTKGGTTTTTTTTIRKTTVTIGGKTRLKGKTVSPPGSMGTNSTGITGDHGTTLLRRRH